MHQLQTKVLVVASTWWAAPARLALAFANAGCRVIAVCPPGHPLLHVSALQQNYRYSWYRPVQSLARAIAASKPDLILPTDDRCVTHLQALYHRADTKLRDVLRRSLGQPEDFAVLTSRFATLELARTLGIRVPRTACLNTDQELDAWSEERPAVLKCSGTWGGSGVHVAHNVAEARAAFAELARPVGAARALKRWAVNRDGFSLRPWMTRCRPEVIVQRFVPGRPANITVACWRGEVVAALTVEALRTQGPIGAAAVARVIDQPDISQAARRLANALQLSGLYGFDFILDTEGRAWLIEMNPRATQLCHFTGGNGTNLAGHLLARLQGTPPPANPPATCGTVIALFPQAWFGQPRDPLLTTAVHDVPWEEPALLRELVGAPWPNRSWMARFWQTHIRPQQWDTWIGAASEPNVRQPNSQAALPT
jgi:glutathione synthase/RimK-type ligase-like ATP-grasp enzyme